MKTIVIASKAFLKQMRVPRCAQGLVFCLALIYCYRVVLPTDHAMARYFEQFADLRFVTTVILS